MANNDTEEEDISQVPDVVLFSRLWNLDLAPETLSPGQQSVMNDWRDEAKKAENELQRRLSKSPLSINSKGYQRPQLKTEKCLNHFLDNPEIQLNKPLPSTE